MLIDSETFRAELRRVRLTDCTDPDAVVLAILDNIERDTAKHRYYEREAAKDVRTD